MGGTILIPASAPAQGNCLPGAKCILPSVFPGVPADTPKITTPKNIKYLNGSFNNLVVDPSFEDDSFVYYLELLSVKSWLSWEDAGKINQNSNCTLCDSVDLTLKHVEGWIDSASLGLSTGLAVGAPPSVSTIGSTFTSTFGLTGATEESFTKKFTLDCCSNTRFLYILNYEESSFKIGWQKDILGGWQDQGFQIYRATDVGVGLDQQTIDGSCEEIPPPPVPVPAPLPVLGIAAAIKKTRDLRRLRSCIKAQRNISQS